MVSSTDMRHWLGTEFIGPNIYSVKATAMVSMVVEGPNAVVARRHNSRRSKWSTSGIVLLPGRLLRMQDRQSTGAACLMEAARDVVPSYYGRILYA